MQHGLAPLGEALREPFVVSPSNHRFTPSPFVVSPSNHRLTPSPFVVSLSNHTPEPLLFVMSPPIHVFAPTPPCHTRTMTALLALALLDYAFAAAAIVRWMSADADDPRRPRFRIAAIVLAAMGVACHAAIHAIAWRESGGPDMHFFASLSLVTLGMAALTAATAWRQQLQTLGVVVYPLAAAMLALYFYDQGQAEKLNWQLQLHVWLALPAYIILSVAALLALLLWFQERALRRRELGGWLRSGPPLVQLETLLFRTIAAGFALLTLALITGVVFVDDLMAQHLWHKTVLSGLSWLVFGWLLFGRWRYGWRGPRAVKFTLSAMALLLLAFFGSKFVLELVLHRS
jgi:ABC-type uncharacterized transport system permease subunit